MAELDRVCANILDEEEKRVQQKSIKVAEGLKAEGNAFYKAKRLPEAVGKYTEALANCPAEDLEKLAVFYGNRSAAFYELGDAEACINDVDRALKRTSDSSLMEKLAARRSKCLQMRQKPLIGDSLKDLNLNGSGDAKTVLDPPRPLEVVLPPSEELLGFEKNRAMPCASSKIDLRWDEGQGRHVVAKTDLKPGETVFVEKPYASILLGDFHSKLCHYCHKKLVSPIPCDNCVEARFCDEECLEKATFHKYECRWAQFFDSIGVGHLALRVLTTAGAARIATESLKSGQKDADIFQDVVRPLDSSDYSSIWRLEHHAEKATSSDAVVYEKNAALLIHYLNTKTSFFQDGLEDLKSSKIDMTKDELINIVKSALLKHIHQLIVNAHAIGHVMEEPSESDPLWHFCDDSSKKGFVALKETKVATGIFPCAGMMNHSCEPNIATSFVGNTVIVRVARRIRNGEDLFNCYGPFARRRPTKLRKKELKLQYFFDCHCSACSDPTDGVWAWADAFACQNCGEPVKDEAKKCGSCKAQLDLSYFEGKLEESNLLWDAGMDQFDATRSKQSIQTLAKAMQIRESVLSKYNRNRGLTYDSLAKCCAMVGDFESSLFHLDLSLACVVARFGENSVEYGYELLKYLEICIALAAQLSAGKKIAKRDEFIQNAKTSYRKALKIFTTLHGPWSESVELLKQLRDSRILLL